MAEDRTEKPTPKRREEARRRGGGPRSTDLGGAIVVVAGIFGLAALAGGIVDRLLAEMHDSLVAAATPQVVTGRNLGALLSGHARAVLLTVGPVVAICLGAGLVASVIQVRPHFSPKALSPDPKRLNPWKGMTNLFGPRALFEGAKTIAKLVAVAAVVAVAVAPRLSDLAALVGLPPAQLLPLLAHEVLGIAERAGAAYLVIALADYAYQRYRHEKSLRMTKQEVREESKGQELPPEVRGAMRRRQVQAARARMMADVPQADVVVTNPTHYAVALRYEPSRLAPDVVAKGQDLVALQIRRIAAEHGVPVVPDPPLARHLHAAVEVGQVIPEELYAAVASVLAFVYRTATRRRLGAPR